MAKEGSATQTGIKKTHQASDRPMEPGFLDLACLNFL